MTGSSMKPERAMHARNLIVPFVLLVALLLMAGCSKELPTVDMSDVVRNGGAHRTKADEYPILYVAVGAMISPEATREYYEELIDMLAGKVGRRAVFSQRRTYEEVNALVANKEVDVAFVCVGPYTKGHDEFGMELLVVPVAHGQTVYHSYILAHRDSAVQSFDDLRGKRFAFTDPQSNTGCLVPTYMLARRGETPDSFFGETFYSYSHDNSIRAVAEGMADGAAVDSLIWEFMNAIDQSLTGRTHIVEKSPPYGIPPVVVHPGLPVEQKEQLRKAFLAIHEDAEAAVLLKRLQIDRFVKGDDGAYDTVREMRRSVEEYGRSGQ